MDGEPQKLPDNALAVSTKPQANIVVADAPTVVESATSVQATSKPSKLKKVIWRGTATVYWTWRIVRVLFGAELMNNLVSTIVVRFNAFLSAVGFAPVHSEYLPRILQIGWLLALAGFKPLELLGLVIYIYIAPATFLGYWVFRDYAKDFSAPPTVKRGLRPPKVRRPALTTFSLLLLGWFILYGEASARRPLIAGAVLSGLLFLILAGRAFQRVKPPTFPDGSEAASAGERVALSMLGSGADTLAKAANAKKKSELIGLVFINRKAWYVWTRLALLMRGQTARNRLYLLLLADYVVSLLVSGAASIFFWAISAKASVAPTAFVRVCSSYFLPNLKLASFTPNLPIWVEAGCAVTAFILFVLFVGAAASLLPLRYSAYTERLIRKYRIARKFALGFKRIAKGLEAIRMSKPI
jgi:hypothetical protein